MPRGLFLLLAAAPVAWALLCGCPPDCDVISDDGCDLFAVGGGGQGGGDAGSNCPTGPVAMLELHIKAQGTVVPASTKLLVGWSAGQEPPFVLGQPGTWGTLANGANVVCDVDPSKPPPTDLAELVCHLWTSGVTHVEVQAAGWVTWDRMVKPSYSNVCKGPVPTKVTVLLTPVPDAGGGGAM